MQQPIILRKKKVVRNVLITRAGGEVKFDRMALPESALTISGIKVSARHIEIDPIDVTTLTYYYGVVFDDQIDALQVAALTVGTYVNTSPEFTVSAGPGAFIYYAHPSSLNDPYFVYQGFQGGFLDHGTVNITKPSGIVTYRVWRSTNANLGAGVTITAIH